MNITNEEISKLLLELEQLDNRAQARIKELKSNLGLKGKFHPKIHEGRIIRGEIQSAIREIREGNLEISLDLVWVLTQKGVKIKTIQFPADHKTFICSLLFFFKLFIWSPYRRNGIRKFSKSG